MHWDSFHLLCNWFISCSLSRLDHTFRFVFSFFWFLIPFGMYEMNSIIIEANHCTHCRLKRVSSVGCCSERTIHSEIPFKSPDYRMLINYFIIGYTSNTIFNYIGVGKLGNKEWNSPPSSVITRTVVAGPSKRDIRKMKRCIGKLLIILQNIIDDEVMGARAK